MPHTPSPPDLSVVLPYVKENHWLVEAILSLEAAAAGLHWELVAIHDRCGDQPAGERLRRLTAHWPPGRLQLLRGEGRGVSAARNLGLRSAQAPWVAFLDADDRALPQRLGAPLAALAAEPQLAHAHGGWLRIHADGTPITVVEPWRDGAGFDAVAALTHKAVLPSAWTLRRDVLLALGGFDETLAHAEDVDLLLRLAAAGHRGAWIEQPLVRYRVHAGGASRNLAAQIDGLSQVVNRHLRPWDATHPNWAAGLRYGTLSWGAWKAWSEGDSQLALQVLRRAAALCPLPLVRRPVHFLEHVARSCRREGLPFALEAFLASPFWHDTRTLLLQAPA